MTNTRQTGARLTPSPRVRKASTKSCVERAGRPYRAPAFSVLALIVGAAIGCQGVISGRSGGMAVSSSSSAGSATDLGSGTPTTPSGGASAVQESGGSVITNQRAFQCDPATDNGVSPERLWRLTGQQYLKTVGVAMSDRQDDANTETQVWVSPAVPFDYVAPDRFSTYSFSYSMSDTEFRRVLDAADYIAAQFVQDSHCCLPKDGSVPSDDCIQHLGSLLFSRRFPLVVLGNAGGALKADGRFLRYAPGQHSLADFFCSLGHAMGVPTDDFGKGGVEQVRGPLAEIMT